MIWIRADANREIGTGHVMRCLSIAAQLKKAGQQVCFLTADENAAKLFQARKQEYIILNSDYRYMEGEMGALKSLLASRGGDFFLVDSYFVTAEYFRKLRKWMRVGYMDDKCLSGFPLDLLINYNIFADASLYGNPPNTRLLMGTRYAPLREEFMDCGYQVRERARRVLVTTGGSDRYNLAGQLVHRAMECEETAKLEYFVVSGAYNIHLQELQELEERYPKVRIYSNVSHMRDLIMECDIAVTAGGSTMYELSAVGVPMVCFSFVDNQERIVEGFSKKNLVCFGGNYLVQGEAMVEKVLDSIVLLAGDSVLRREYSRRIKNVVDGQGAVRIAQELTALEK